MLIVLEARDPESVEIPLSFGSRLAAAFGKQTRAGDRAETPYRSFNRWIADLSLQNRSVTLALVVLLIISSLAFGLGSALQINLIERPGSSVSGKIGDLIGGRNTGGSAVGQEIGQTPALVNTLPIYGATLSWLDRFNFAEVRRETANSKVLWPFSTVLSMLIAAAYLLPRSTSELSTSAGD